MSGTLRSVYQIDVGQARQGLDELITRAQRLDTIIRNMPHPMFPGGGGRGPGGGGGGGGGAGPAGPMQAMLSASERLARQWAIMRDHSRAVAGHVLDTTRRLASITGLLGTLTGLVTGFGFLGFNTLARSATASRMAALQADQTFGGMSAARGAFGPYANVQQLLTAVANARTDPSKAPGLNQLFGAAPGGDPGLGAPGTTLMARLLQGAANLYKQYGSSAAVMWRSIPGLDIVPLETAREVANLPPGELEAQRQLGGRFAQRLNVTPAQQQAFTHFVATIDLARASIEATFYRSLSPLAPSLEKLSVAASDFLNSLLSHKEIGEFIEKLAAKLGEWATVVGSKEFVTNVENFVARIGQMANAIGAFLKRFFGWLTSDGDGKGDGKTAPEQAAPGGGDPLRRPGQTGTLIPGTQGPGSSGLYRQADGTIRDDNGRIWHQDEYGGWVQGAGPPQAGGVPEQGMGDPARPTWMDPSMPQIDLRRYNPFRWNWMPSTPEGAGGLMGPAAYHPFAGLGGGAQGGTIRPIPVMPWPLPLPVTLTLGPDEARGGRPGLMPAAFRTGDGLPFTGDMPPQAAGGGPGFGDRAQWLMGHLTKDLGLTPEQAAGFASNIASESGISAGTIAAGGDFGLAQWVGSRKRDLFNWSLRQGLDPRDREVQWEFMRRELEGPYRKYLEALRQSHSALEAQQRSFGYESNEDPRLEYHRSDHGRFVQQLQRLIEQMKRGDENPDPGLHEPPRRSQSVHWRSQQVPLIMIRNQTGGDVTTSAHLMAV